MRIPLLLLAIAVAVMGTGCGSTGETDGGITDDGGTDGDGTVDGSDGDGVADCNFDPGVTWNMLGDILQMESQDGSTCVWLQREDLCPSDMICKAHPFDFQAIRIGHDGSLVEIVDPDKLSWSATHHNWSDTGEARTEDTTYVLQGVSFGQAYEITASGGENWGPVHLDPWAP